MSIKLRALGLGLLAALAMSAVAVMNASATTGGHFTSEVANTNMHGTQLETNEFHYGGRTVKCNETTFTGSTAATTVTEVTITPTYGDCDSSIAPAHVRMNGCHYVFTIGKKASEDNTVHLLCPANKLVEIEVTIPIFSDCTLTIRAQTPKGGVAYNTGGSGKTHDIEADITVSGVHVARDGNSICGAATGETGELTGSATLQGFNAAGGAQVGITATGSED